MIRNLDFNLIDPLLQFPHVLSILRILKDSGKEGRLVGGCVRDCLMGKTIQDIDIAVNAPIREVAQIFEQNGFRVLLTGVQYGTITILIDQQSFELTQLREDRETDGRHAVVSLTDDWQKDASRRDFTINALYLDQYGKIYDYFEGLKDLEDGVVRFIGEASVRIQEDYLRILRYYRFAFCYGKTLDLNAWNAVVQFQQGLTKLSKERVQSELFKILATQNPLLVLQQMQQDGVFKVLFDVDADLSYIPSLILMRNWEEKFVYFELLMLWGVLRGSDEFFYSFFRLTHVQRNMIKILNGYQNRTLSKTVLFEIRCLYNAETAQLWLLFKIADLFISDLHRLQQAHLLYQEMMNFLNTALTEFPLKGQDLVNLGWKEGVKLGIALKQCKEWWIQTQGRASKQECLDFCIQQLEN